MLYSTASYLHISYQVNTKLTPIILVHYICDIVSKQMQFFSPKISKAIFFDPSTNSLFCAKIQ